MSESIHSLQTPEEYKNRISPGKSWAEIVAWIGDLPPLPHVASQAIVLIEDPDASAAKLTDLLGKDTALAARVLKIANSAMFSRQREITTLSQAIMTIGFKALKGIIVAATLRQLNRRFGKIEQMIWQNSTYTATCSMVISQQLRKSYPDEVFLLGLLHDLGKLVLIRQMPTDYGKVLDLASAEQQFFEVEQDHLGFAHPLIGALVAKKWNFSPEACQVILHHHDELEFPYATPTDEKTAIIQLANMLSHSAGYGHVTAYADFTESINKAAERLGIDGSTLEKVKEETGRLFSDQGSVYS